MNSQDDKEEILTVAKLNLESQSKDKDDGIIGSVGEDELDGEGVTYTSGDESGDSIEKRKGKKLVPTDSLRRNRERFSKTSED